MTVLSADRGACRTPDCRYCQNECFLSAASGHRPVPCIHADLVDTNAVRQQPMRPQASLTTLSLSLFISPSLSLSFSPDGHASRPQASSEAKVLLSTLCLSRHPLTHVAALRDNKNVCFACALAQQMPTPPWPPLLWVFLNAASRRRSGCKP